MRHGSGSLSTNRGRGHTPGVTQSSLEPPRRLQVHLHEKVPEDRFEVFADLLVDAKSFGFVLVIVHGLLRFAKLEMEADKSMKRTKSGVRTHVEGASALGVGPVLRTVSGMSPLDGKLPATSGKILGQSRRSLAPFNHTRSLRQWNGLENTKQW